MLVRAQRCPRVLIQQALTWFAWAHLAIAHVSRKTHWSTWRLANRLSSGSRCVSARAPARARSAGNLRVRVGAGPPNVCSVWGVSSSSVPAPVLVLDPPQCSVWGVSNSSVPASALETRANRWGVVTSAV